MSELIITEDFSIDQKEFDERFCTEQACYEYLFNLLWPEGFLDMLSTFLIVVFCLHLTSLRARL